MIYKGRDLDAVALWEEFVEWPAGAKFSGEFAPLVRCPGNHSNKKHFQVNLEKPLVHCFALCGLSGTYEHAIAQIKGIDERAARKLIVQRTGIGLGGTPGKRTGRKRGKREAVQEIVSLDYERYIPEFGLDYLAARGVTSSGLARHEIGWDAEERRIVIPADDERGVRRFLIKRAVREKDWPKYLYWPEKELCGWGKTDILYGACHLDTAQVRSDGLVVTEGSFDKIRLDQHGLQATAILGTGLSDRQAQIIMTLRPKRIYLMFDKDAAGVRNVKAAAQQLTKLPIFVCLYPKAKSDPAQLTKEVSHRMLDNAISLVEFAARVEKKVPGYGLTTRPKRRKEPTYGRH